MSNTITAWNARPREEAMRTLLERAAICIEAATKTLPNYNPSLYPGTLLKEIRALLVPPEQPDDN